jgi:hypothetical protein
MRKIKDVERASVSKERIVLSAVILAELRRGKNLRAPPVREGTTADGASLPCLLNLTIEARPITCRRVKNP